MRRAAYTVAIAMLWLAAVAAPARAELEFGDPWVAEPPPGAMATGAFMVVTNRGDTEQRIVGASSPSCRRVELHQTRIEGGMARMMAQKQVVVPAGESVAFERGSYHLMLIGPEKLRAGEKVEISIELADGEKHALQAEVRRR